MGKKSCVQIDGKRVLIVGMGKTGLATARALQDRTREMLITDTRSRTEIATAMEEATSTGARFVTMDAVPVRDIDVVIISPGIPIDQPLFKRFRTRKVPVIAEIEVAYSMMAGMLVAVTGTNGKTTTTSLIGEILRGHFPDVRVAGNIGEPFIEAVQGSDESTVFVVEVSSYQLEGIASFRPAVAVVLNVTPDHIDRHSTIEQYAAAKARLLENQVGDDVVILNFDDPIVKKMAVHSRCKTLLFGTLEAGTEGAFLSDHSIMVRLRGEQARLMDSTEVPLPGRHNCENVMAAALAAGWIGVPWEIIRGQTMRFRGLEHRMETVAETGEVTFVNDSKATNVAASLVALRSFEPGRVIIILGGDDKGLDYGELVGEVVARAKHVVLVGNGLKRLIGEIRNAGFGAVTHAKTMEAAVAGAKAAARPGDVVLLSPASSSFDLFENFEERGKAFKNAVRQIEKV